MAKVEVGKISEDGGNAPVIDLQEPKTQDNHQSLKSDIVKDGDHHECLESMPVLSLEVSGDELGQTGRINNGHSTDMELKDKETSEDKDSHIDGNSFQSNQDAEADESVRTHRLDRNDWSSEAGEKDLSEDFDAKSSTGIEEMESSHEESRMDTDEPPAPTSSNNGQKQRRKRQPRSELDRLLMDEGTVRILLGQAKGDTSKVPGATRRDKLNELKKNRDLVINQVRDSSKTKLFDKVSLRVKTKTKRQQSEEKRNVGKKSKAVAEPASKIVRRRSSSCSFNFSSRSPSPLPLNASLQSVSQDYIQVRVESGIGYICIDSEAIIFNTKIASRLNTTLNSFKHDDNISVVQLTAGSDFIQGLDIEGIKGETDDSLRESMADSMVACLDTLLKTLINYPKLLVAGVTGDALDFGVLILSYFDIVYASDKAKFRTNYANHGYLPECLQLFPKNRLTSAMLYTGKRLSAAEAAAAGLITEVIPAAKFNTELEHRTKSVAASNQRVLLQTKAEMNTKKSSKLELTRDLRSSWLTF